MSSFKNADQPNSVPFDCPTFKKILIDTTASRNNKIVVAKGSISSDVQIASESQGKKSHNFCMKITSELVQILTDEPSDGVSFAETPATVDNPVAEPSVTVSGTLIYNDNLSYLILI